MKVVVKQAFRSFWATRSTEAKMWQSEVNQYKEELEANGDLIVDIIPLTNPYGKIRFWIFKVQEKET